MRLRPAITLACTLVAAAATGCEGTHRASLTPQPAPQAGVHWEQGTTHRFDVQMKASSELSGAPAPAWGFALSAKLELTPEPVTGTPQTTWLHGLLRSPDVTSDSIEEAALQPMEAELSLPFAVRLDDGGVGAMKVSTEVSGQSMALLRTLVSSLQVPSGGEAQKVVEHDATGQYEARYARTGPVVHRTKLRYLRLLTVGGGLDSKLVPRILRGTASVRLTDGRAIASAKIDERYEMTLPTGAKMLVDNVLTVTATGVAAAGALAQLAEGALDVAADEPFGQALSKDRFDDVRIGDRTLPQVLDTLAAGAGASDDTTMDAFSAVVAFARRDPGHVTEIIERARETPEQARRLFDALASAGSPEAQQALISVVDTPGSDAVQRRAAARSLIRVRDPIEAQVALLVRLARDRALREHGIYGLGTAARRLRGAGATDRAAAIGERLRRLLSEATDDPQRMRVLRGIANAADAALLGSAQPLLQSEAFGVREAAVFALQRMPGVDVDRVLVEQLAKEGHASVRTAVVRAYDHRAPSAEAVEALAQAATKDPNTHVRYAAITAMGKWVGKFPQLRPVLEEIGRSDAEPKLQRQATALLASAPDAG